MLPPTRTLAGPKPFDQPSTPPGGGDNAVKQGASWLWSSGLMTRSDRLPDGGATLLPSHDRHLNSGAPLVGSFR